MSSCHQHHEAGGSYRRDVKAVSCSQDAQLITPDCGSGESRRCQEECGRHRKRHFTYTIEYEAIQGWLQMLQVVAFLITLCLMLILSAQIFEKIAWREGIVIIVPEFFFVIIAIIFSIRQQLRHAWATLLSGVIVVSVNGYFAFRMLYVLFDCDNHELCSFDPMIYVWYCGSFVALEAFCVIALGIAVRVYPSIHHIHGTIEHYQLLDYVHMFERTHASSFGCCSVMHAKHDNADTFVVHANHHAVSSIRYRFPRSGYGDVE